MKRIATPRYSHRGLTISIYHSGSRFSAHFVLDGERQRIERSTEALALGAAKRFINDQFGVDSTDRLEEKTASDIVAARGMCLVEAARLIDHQLERLTPLGKTISDAVDYYLKQHAVTPITVDKAVDELIAKVERDCGKLYTDDLHRRLRNRFCMDFGTRLMNSLTGPEIAAWIDSQPGKPRTRRNFHSSLVTLFNFAQERGYVSDSQLTAAEKVKKPKAGRSPRLIFSPAELESLIKGGIKIQSRGLVPLVVQCFCGVRSSELCQTDPKKDRIRWADILLDQPQPEIHVREEVSKTDQERYVPIPECLLSWLKLLQSGKPSTPLYGGNQLWKDYYAISAAGQITWKKNAPRKSFNTYHSALSDSLATTAKAAGNTAQIIQRFYRKEIPQAQKTAIAWFSLGTDAFPKTLIAALTLSRPK